ncbi:MAG: PilW family protein [Deltaproteobacteria bacterium]|nr:PilW family protein [Deltaproteobacteria bacterium]
MIAVPNNNKGFTLIELLIAMAVSSIVMALIISAFGSQQKAHVTQQQVVDMQQNIRAAMYLMESEIRMAGCDPTGNAGAGIQTAGPNSIGFTMDIDGNADTTGANENITFGFSAANDADGDGTADAGVGGAAPLGRDTADGSGFMRMAEDIHAIGFAYAYDDDNDDQLDFVDANGNGQHDAGEPVIWAIDSDNNGTLDKSLDTNSDGVIDTSDTAGGVALAATVNINNIRAVRIWLLARTGAPIRGYSDTGTYVVGDRRITPGDRFQRRLLTASIKCRNMGL